MNQEQLTKGLQLSQMIDLLERQKTAIDNVIDSKSATCHVAVYDEGGNQVCTFSLTSGDSDTIIINHKLLLLDKLSAVKKEFNLL